MNNRLTTNFYRICTAVVVEATLCMTASAAPAQQGFVLRPDGTRIPLQELAYPAADENLQAQPTSKLLGSAPKVATRVDLSRFQSPVKDQGGRNTCGVFGTVAAVEAAYRRNYGISLDLSEQYLNHWGQQFLTPKGRALPGNETNAGSIGGGGMWRPLSAMSQGLAVPPESALPYIPDGSYEVPNVGDIPSLNDWSLVYPQRDMDDFNLADQPASYSFDGTHTVVTTVMPQQALDQARYRPRSVTYFSAAQLRDLNAYRAALAEQHELIIEMRCCDGNPGWHSKNPWVIPPGSNGGGAAHVMLIVGFDDFTRMFRIKNSWSTGWADGGYAWISYDSVLTAAVGVAYLDELVSPYVVADPWNFRHFVLGRWQLNFDGWKGVLDIYDLPDEQSPSNKILRNYRIGTLFMNDGRMHRVNGIQEGNELTFWVDWNNPDVAPDKLTGSIFKVRIFSRDHRSMAGTLSDDPNGATYSVEMVKGDSPVTGVARSNLLSPSSYLGIWDLNHDGWRGRLEITNVDSATRSLSGRYVEANGTVRRVSGTVNADARLFTLTIEFPTPQRFDGFLNGHELGVMAGNTYWGGMTFGFYGTRRL